MARMEALNRRSDLRAHLARTSGSGSLLEVDAWIPSEVEAISPLADRLMRLIEGSHCIIGEEHDVELALREALSNAVVHSNRQGSQISSRPLPLQGRERNLAGRLRPRSRV
jgi:hypothetical protein